MPVAPRLRNHMRRCGARFAELPHQRTFEMAKAARAAHVSGKNVAKGVLVATSDGPMLVVLPASRRINMTQLRRWLGREVGLASEADAAVRFSDCEMGAIPPIGSAYDLETVVDDSIMLDDEIYFEGGDHRTLVAMGPSDFRRLLGDVGHGSFSA